jgi:hypothetical protein
MLDVNVDNNSVITKAIEKASKNLQVEDLRYSDRELEYGIYG